MKKIQLAATILILIPLAACLSLTSKQPPPALYALHPGETAAAIPVAGSPVVEVAEPQLPAGFDTDRIALQMQGGRRLDYYAGAKWPGPLDEALQDFIVESARQAWAGPLVDTPDLSVPAHYRLAVTVNDLQPVYAAGPESAPELRARLTFTLIALPEEKPVTSFTLKAAAPAASNDLSAVTGGLETLLRAILAEGLGRLAPMIQRGNSGT